MSTFTIDLKDIDALLTGLAIYGTGGGGDPEWGRIVLENDFARGRVCELINPENVPDDAFVCSGGLMGSVKSLENLSYRDVVGAWEDGFVLLRAFRMMEELKGRKLDYIIPFEVGGINTPVIMSLAARMGIPMINGDALGRSAPETQMTSFIGHGVPLTPMPLVDHLGNAVIVMKSNENTYADEIGRFVVTKGGALGGNAHYPMSGAQLKSACIPKTITGAVEIGKVVLGAQGNDPVEAFRKHVGGNLLFTGVISDVTGEDKGGFYLTNVAIDGSDAFGGKEGRIVVKNESMVVWVDGQIKIIFPDNAYMLYTKTGEGIMSVDLKRGVEISIVGAPCHKRLRECMLSEQGMKAFGGARYGHPEIAYQKFEELIRD